MEKTTAERHCRKTVRCKVIYLVLLQKRARNIFKNKFIEIPLSQLNVLSLCLNFFAYFSLTFAV